MFSGRILTTASIDKQKALKYDYIYNIENTDLEIGVSGVLTNTIYSYWSSFESFPVPNHVIVSLQTTHQR